MIAFKDLCLDAVDPARLADFWSAVLGLDPQPDGPGGRLVGQRSEHTVWLNPVPEPRTVKQRVHLDVHTGSVAELVARGATVLAELPHWTVLADPEGGEFCAFVRDPQQLSRYRGYELVVDAADCRAIAQWWAGAYGGVPVEHDPAGFSWLEQAPGLPWPLVFVGVPEPKTVKNRIHWDVWGDAGELLAAGARLLRRRDDEIDWDVLADPEGNEFCVFSPRN